MIKHKTVSSSAVSALDYNTESKQLVITFTDGSKYKYFGVPAWVYYEFLGAESFGKYYNESFRNEDFEFIKMN